MANKFTTLVQANKAPPENLCKMEEAKGIAIGLLVLIGIAKFVSLRRKARKGGNEEEPSFGQCPKCGAQIEEGFEACWNCGEQFETEELSEQPS